jgi:hypothetical protein
MATSACSTSVALRAFCSRQRPQGEALVYYETASPRFPLLFIFGGKFEGAFFAASPPRLSVIFRFFGGVLLRQPTIDRCPAFILPVTQPTVHRRRRPAPAQPRQRRREAICF